MSVWNTILNDEPAKPRSQSAREPRDASPWARTLPPACNTNKKRPAFSRLAELWKRKAIILLCLILCIALGHAYTRFETPIYKATTSILIEQANGNAAPGLLATEVEIIRSHKILTEALKKLGAKHDQAALSAFQNTLSVEAISGASIIKITAQDPHADKAAKIANAVAQSYTAQKMETNYKQAEKATQWREEKRKSLEDRLQKDVEELQKHQGKSGQFKTNILTFRNQEYLQLNRQILEAEKAYNAARIRHEDMRKQSKRKGGLGNLEEVQNSPVISSLRVEELNQKAALAALEKRYGVKHPKRIAAQTRLEKTQTQILREIRNIATSFDRDLRITETNLEQLKSRVSSVRSDFKRDKDQKVVALTELELKAEGSRRLYESFLNASQTPPKNLHETNAKILSYAQAPLSPSHPDKSLVLLISVITGLICGIAIAAIRAGRDDRFKQLNELEDYTGFPLYGTLPQIKAKDPIRVVLDKPASTLAESLRSLRMNLALRAYADEDIRVITMTSTSPGEGKSTLSAWLGSISAATDEKILIIDCDLRRPKMHRYFGLNQVNSLIDYLTDRAELSDIIQTDERSKLDIITCQSTPTHALSLLTSTKMEAMLDELRDQYDLIILDAPAASSLSDPYILSKMSDRTFFVVEWEKTGRKAISTAIKKFYDIRSENVGMVINKLDFQTAGVNDQAHLSYAYFDPPKSKKKKK